MMVWKICISLCCCVCLQHENNKIISTFTYEFYVCICVCIVRWMNKDARWLYSHFKMLHAVRKYHANFDANFITYSCSTNTSLQYIEEEEAKHSLICPTRCYTHYRYLSFQFLGWLLGDSARFLQRHCFLWRRHCVILSCVFIFLVRIWITSLRPVNYHWILFVRMV